MNPEIPAPGKSMLKRAFAAMTVIVLMSAGAVWAAGYLQLDEIQREFNKFSQGSLELPEISAWEAGEPRTIMILGTDERLGADAVRGEKPRSDTIILARLDAKKDAISLMSIPRDLKVTIPGYQLPDKINAAFSNGKAALTLKTVKQLLSTPGRAFKIHHVVQVNFTGFRRMVDFLGCSYVDVDRDYFNDVSGPGGYAVIDIDPGYQKVCGEDALAYVRYRHTDNDLVRGARQQDFVRQLLRQRGVRRRLVFNNAKELVRIAARYTKTDRGLSRSKQSLISLLKLGLAVADKPVQEVPFGVGRLQDDGNYLIASDAAIEETVDQFLKPKTVTAKPTGTAEPSSSKKKKSSKRKKSASSEVSGLINVESAGENMAISADRRLDFPFYYPKLGASTGRYVGDQARIYKIKGYGGKRYQAYRMVVHLGAPGEFYGVQGMTWKHPPILDGASDTEKEDGRRLRVFYDGKRVRLVSWRTSNGVYYVHNTLTRSLTKDRMVAIARSLTRLGAK